MHTRLLIGLMAIVSAAGAATLEPARLRWEEQVNARLSWIVGASDPAQRGLRQTAYRILVASRPREVATDQAIFRAPAR